MCCVTETKLSAYFERDLKEHGNIKRMQFKNQQDFFKLDCTTIIHSINSLTCPIEHITAIHKSSLQNVHQKARVRARARILDRILILTILYEICFFGATIVNGFDR
eukprot:343979_1